MRAKSVWGVGAVVVAGAGLLGACSSGAGKSPGTPVSLTAANITYSPTDIKVSAGQKVTFTVKNNDKIEHNLTIEDLKVNKDVGAGKTGTATVTVPAGTYAFHCEYHPDQMKGTITAG